jgi:hypothetical protein
MQLTVNSFVAATSKAFLIEVMFETHFVPNIKSPVSNKEFVYTVKTRLHLAVTSKMFEEGCFPGFHKTGFYLKT